MSLRIANSHKIHVHKIILKVIGLVSTYLYCSRGIDTMTTDFHRRGLATQGKNCSFHYYNNYTRLLLTVLPSVHPDDTLRLKKRELQPRVQQDNGGPEGVVPPPVDMAEDVKNMYN